MILLESFHYFMQILKLIINGFSGKIDMDLTGSRWSGKTIAVIKFVLLVMSLPGLTVMAAFARYTPKGAGETFEEYMDVAIEEFNYKEKQFNQTKKTHKFNNNTVKFFGYKSNTKAKTPKLGLMRKMKRDIVILVIDEITEFKTPKEVELIKQAMGGAKLVITIRVSNPWTLAHFFIKEDALYNPYRKSIMEQTGNQFKQEWVTDTHLKVSHHSNHRVNTFLSPVQHASLIDLWKIDQHMALICDLGLPGAEQGAVYAHELNKIKKPLWSLPVEEYRGGVDWGESSAEGGSATTALIGRIGPQSSYVAIDKEYYHSNSEDLQYKSTDVLVREVVKMFITHIEENRAKIHQAGGITVYVDFAATGIISMLRTEANKHKLGIYLDFRECIKYEVQARIRVVKYIMQTNRLHINRTACIKLWEELELAVYDVDAKPGVEVRIKENDHCLDAMEYLIGRSLWQFTDEHYSAMYGKHDKINLERK